MIMVIHNLPTPVHPGLRVYRKMPWILSHLLGTPRNAGAHSAITKVCESSLQLTSPEPQRLNAQYCSDRFQTHATRDRAMDLWSPPAAGFIKEPAAHSTSSSAGPPVALERLTGFLPQGKQQQHSRYSGKQAGTTSRAQLFNMERTHVQQGSSDTWHVPIGDTQET